MPDGTNFSQYVKIDGKMVLRAAQLLELDRVECEEDLHFFLRKAWRFIDPAPFKDGWVIDALCEHLEAVCDGQLPRLLINIPPRCSKSSICSVAFPAWVWAQAYHSPTSGPGVPILHASYAHSLALRDSVKRRRLIKSTWYRSLFGDRFSINPDQDQKIRFSNTEGGESLITSVDAGVTGEGGNIILVDDPNNAREALSEAVIQTTNEEWWDGSMATRLNDPATGAIVVIQQRLGEEDLSGHILDNDKRQQWEHLVLPMEFDPSRRASTSIGWRDPRMREGELLWPARFNRRAVEDIKGRLRSKWRIAGQLQQAPEPKGGGIIQRLWWKTWPPEGEEFDERGRASQPLNFPPFNYILASLDSAFTENTMNDPSALTVWGVFHTQDPEAINYPTRQIRRENRTIRVYAEDAEELTKPQIIPKVMLIYAWADHLEFHDLIVKVDEICTKWKADKLLVEAKASGIPIAQEMLRMFGNSKFSVQLQQVNRGTASAGFNDKVSRLYSVQHLFEEGMVYAPDRPWADMVMNQCGTFPNGQHDDLVDTTSQALRHLRALGLLSRPPELQAETARAITHRGRSRVKPLYPGSRA